MAADDLTALQNHYCMFGPAALCKRLGRRWVVQFRGHGYPGVFATKTAAVEWAALWVRTVRSASAAGAV